MMMPKFTPAKKAAIAKNVLVRVKVKSLENEYNTVVRSAGILVSHEFSGHPPQRVLVIRFCACHHHL